MKISSDKNFLLLNLSSAVVKEQIVSLFEKTKGVLEVIFHHDNEAAFSHYFASVRLNEAIQPYFLPTFFENIRAARLNDCPVIIVPVFLVNPSDVNKLFDSICQILDVSDLDGFRQAEMYTCELVLFEKKVRHVEIAHLITMLKEASSSQVINLKIVEKQLDEFKAIRRSKINKIANTKRSKSKFHQSGYRLTQRDRLVLKNGIPNLIDVPGKVYSREPGVVSHSIFDEKRVPIEKLGQCPHGVPVGRLCAICDPDEFRKMTGIE